MQEASANILSRDNCGVIQLAHMPLRLAYLLCFLDMAFSIAVPKGMMSATR